MRDDIYEQLRRIEFNKTEPEVLTELVKEAIRYGTNHSSFLSRLHDKAIKVIDILKNNKLLHEIEVNDYTYSKMKAIGIDGSMQITGNIGRWFVMLSAVIVKFEDITSIPKVMPAVQIEEINEPDPKEANRIAEEKMFLMESKAIKKAALEADNNTILFIDGPVIDPPYYTSEEYIKFRCEAFSNWLSKGAFVLGITKRVLGNLFINFVINNILSNDDKSLIKDLYSDYALACYVFTSLFRNSNGNHIFCTVPFNILDLKDKEDRFTKNIYSLAETYNKYNINIYTMLIQTSISAKPIRIDIPIISGNQKNLDIQKVCSILKNWSPPSHFLPLPIILAHTKCNIRKGCAEVIYNEIISRGSSSDYLHNLINMKLTGELEYE
ncbi:MAG: DNA double-strand break repair nuclease NurA [Candidatus Nitrosocaldus sp.]